MNIKLLLLHLSICFVSKMALETEFQPKFYFVIYPADSKIPSGINTPPSDEGISDTRQLQHKPVLLGTCPSDIQGHRQVVLEDIPPSQQLPLEPPITVEGSAIPILYLPATIVPAGKIDEAENITSDIASNITSDIQTKTSSKKRRNLMELTPEDSLLVQPYSLKKNNIKHMTPEKVQALKKKRRRLLNRLYARASRKRMREKREALEVSETDISSETLHDDDDKLEHAKILLQLQQSTD